MRRSLAAALVLVVAAGGLVACGSDEPDGSPSTRPRSTMQALPAPAPGPFTTTGRGPELPPIGAWFGAYANSPLNVNSRLAAIDEFEELIGRPLAIAHSFHPWRDEFPTIFDYELVNRGKLVLMSWAGTDTRSILSGVYDEEIRRRAEAVRLFRVPVLLRYRWEMDRPNLVSVVHTPEDYIAAWKYVREIFTEVGALNAAWVWCPHADGFVEGRAQAYYPGDDQVDWLCADVYPGVEMRTFEELMAPVLEFARIHPRPLLIGEFGVREGEPGERARWFDEMAAAVAQHPQIKAAVYFHSKQDTKPKYDMTIGAPDETLAAFRKIVNSPTFQAHLGG